MSWLIEEQIRQQFESNSKTDLLIATPTRDGKVSQHWSLASRQLELPMPLEKVSWAMESGQPVDISRNIGITKALQVGAKHILFWDSDTIPPPHALKTIYNLRLPLVGCVYRSRGPPFQLLANKGNVPLSDEVLKQPQIIEVDQLGAGFLLVDMRVIQKYARKLNHWQCLADHTLDTGEFVASFDNQNATKNGWKCSVCQRSLLGRFFDYRAGKTGKHAISEDYYFEAKVKELGFKLFAATICCTHENSFSYVGQEPKLETWLANAGDVR